MTLFRHKFRLSLVLIGLSVITGVIAGLLSAGFDQAVMIWLSGWCAALSASALLIDLSGL